MGADIQAENNPNAVKNFQPKMSAQDQKSKIFFQKSLSGCP